MSNHARQRPHGPAWLERGAKLRGRRIRTKARGERGGRASRGVKPGGGGIGAPMPRLHRQGNR